MPYFTYLRTAPTQSRDEWGRQVPSFGDIICMIDEAMGVPKKTYKEIVQEAIGDCQCEVCKERKARSILEYLLNERYGLRYLVGDVNVNWKGAEERYKVWKEQNISGKDIENCSECNGSGIVLRKKEKNEQLSGINGQVPENVS